MIRSLSDIVDGGDFEEWFFGRKAVGKRDFPYIPFEEGYREALEAQGTDWNPLKPEAPGSARLLHYAKEAIRNFSNGQEPEVSINRLVRSRFDSFHGADGSLEYQGERLLFDITISRAKYKEKGKGPADYSREQIYLITLEGVKKGNLGYLGYMMGYILLKKVINTRIRRNPGNIPLLNNSGEDVLSEMDVRTHA